MNTPQTWLPRQFPLSLKEEVSWDLGLAFLAAFVFTVNINVSHLFPVLMPLRLQIVFGTLAFLIFLANVASGRMKWSWPPIVVWYLLYFLVALLSLEGAVEAGLWDIGSDVVSGIAKQFIILILLACYASNEIGFRRLLFVFLISIGLYDLHSFKAIVMGAALLSGRFESFLGQAMNSDYIGVFNVMMMFLTLEIGRKKPRGSLGKRILLLMSAVSCLIAVLTKTRAAFLALVLVGAIWMIRRENRREHLPMMLLLCAIVIVVGMNTTTEKGTYFDRMQSIFASEEERDYNSRSRLLLWQEGIRLGMEHPLLGVGSGATGSFLPPELEGVSMHYLGDERRGFSLHQTFIQIWAERGLLGLVTFGGFLYAMWRSLRSAQLKIQGKPEESFWAPVLSGLNYALLTYLVGSFFMSLDTDWTIVILAGLAAGTATATRQESQVKSAIISVVSKPA